MNGPWQERSLRPEPQGHNICPRYFLSDINAINLKSIINPLEKYQLRADKKVYAALFDGTLDAGPSFDEEKLSRLSE